MDEDRWQRKRERFERKMGRFERRWEMRRNRYHHPGGHLFAGFLFVAIGVLFLLGNMGLVDTRSVFVYWPVLLIAMGAFKLVESRSDIAHSPGVFWIVVGGLFLLGNLGILRVAFRDFWPVMLIGFGVLMLWRSALVKRGPTNFWRYTEGPRPDAGPAPGTTGAAGAAPAPEPEPSGPMSSNSIVSAMAVLGSVEHRNNSQDFRGGSATAVMGRCEIDLRAANFAGHEPVLQVFAMWGGIEVRVPPDWTVVSQVDPILGGYMDDTQPPKEGAKRFLIRGTVLMGGIDVTN
jgi:predicted membrane protein